MFETLRCFICGRSENVDSYRCSACGGVLEFERTQDLQSWVTPSVNTELSDSLWTYRNRLPEVTDIPVSLTEGKTPLRELDVAAFFGSEWSGRLLVKDETRNPTGSFKDRMMTVAVSRALYRGAKIIVCASTGNAAASAAAYAAAAGLRCIVCVPVATPIAKLRQSQAYGAQVVTVSGNYSDAYAFAKELEEVDGFVNLTTTYRNPVAVAGLWSIGYELIDQLENPPDLILIPTGAGPLVRGIDSAYRQAATLGVVERRPRLVAVQASGCAPIVAAFERRTQRIDPWSNPDTVAKGIADPLQGYAEEGELTLDSLRFSEGWATAVPDELIQQAAHLLCTRAGLLPELAGAAGLAGLIQSSRAGLVPEGSVAVVLVTGSGLKDVESQQKSTQEPLLYDPGNESAQDLAKRVLGRA